MMKSKGIVSLILTFVGVPALTIAGLFGWQAFHQNRQPLIAKRGEAAYSVSAIFLKLINFGFSPVCHA